MEQYLEVAKAALNALLAKIQADPTRMTATVVLGALFGAMLFYKLLFAPRRVKPSPARVVVISGCDTGFGRGLAVKLSRSGFNVFAACLTDKGIAELAVDAPGATAFKCDITKEEDIAAAAKLVQQRSGGAVYALVNNAGIGASGNVDWAPMSQYRRVLEVNYFGHVAMTKAFLPMLMEQQPAQARDGGAWAQRGRIINVCSVAGFMAAPGMSAYASSKFALEAFSDSLRREMYDWRMPVVAIEPGFMATHILHGLDAALEAIWRALPESTRARWGEDYFAGRIRQTRRVNSEAADPALVVDVMADAITSPRPEARYKVGGRAKYLYWPLARLLPEHASDWLIATVYGIIAPGKPAGLSTQQ